MNAIVIKSFAGCPVSEDLLRELEGLAKINGFELSHDKVFRADDSGEKGLYGTPTIIINGKEYQGERRGAAGIYCRNFVTPDGIKNYPHVEDVLRVAEGLPGIEHNKTDTEPLQFPVLLVSQDCVFTKPAKNFWSKVADEAGVELHVVIIEKNQTAVEEYSASGLPCLAVKKGENYYGFHFSHQEGRNILHQVS